MASVEVEEHARKCFWQCFCRALEVPWNPPIVPHFAVPNTAPAPPRAAPGASGRLKTPGREAGPLGKPPIPPSLAV
eukprot:scaffold120129_cov54-Phaeocystis_antarctica.AAC.3